MVDRTYKGPGGLIVRTAAHGAKKSDFVREIGYLHKLNDVLDRRIEQTKAPDLVFQEADLPVRVLRDVFLADFEKAIIDSEKQFERVTNFFQRTAPELVGGVELYKGSKPLFEKWGIDKEIESTLNRPARGRLPDHRLRRGADGDRRQQRQLHRSWQRWPGGNDHQGQHRGRRRGRAPAETA
jgi:Rne/Rng family ribonuclease